MADKLNKESTVNIYEQDFRDIRAYATSLAGQVFFEGIECGAIFDAAGDYIEKKATVYIGKLKEEKNNVIALSEAIAISPVKLKNIQRVTNYSPLDCLRALYFELRELTPVHLSNQLFKREEVRLERSLENI